MAWILQLHPPPPMDERGTYNKPEGLYSESLSWLEAPWSTMEWILQLHALPHGWERYLKQARGPTQWELILVRSTMGWILQLHPLPPWMREVLKTSQRAWTVRAYLGWKHHEAPWGEYYNSTPSPNGWKRYLKQARGPGQWELISVGSIMKHHGVNITTPPPPPTDERGT